MHKCILFIISNLYDDLRRHSRLHEPDLNVYFTQPKPTCVDMILERKNDLIRESVTYKPRVLVHRRPLEPNICPESPQFGCYPLALRPSQFHLVLESILKIDEIRPDSKI